MKIMLNPIKAIGSNNKNKIEVLMNNYVNSYDIDPEGHWEIIANLYDLYKDYILQGQDNRSWLDTNNVFIKYGDDDDSNSDKVKIMISSIYRDACRFRDD